MLRESHNNQGSAAAETNDHKECLDHNKTWLKMSLERVTDSGQQIIDYELGAIYNEVGVAYAMNDLYDDAVRYFLESIKVFQALDDYEETMLGWPEPNLGFMYWVLDRQLEAEQVLLEILEIHATAWGVDDRKSFK